MSSEDVSKTSWRRLQDMSSKRLQDVFKTYLQDALKTSWKTKNCYAEDVLKIFSRHVLKTSWRRLQDQQIFAGKALSLLPFPGKTWLVFVRFPGLFLAENRAGSQIRGSEWKFDISYFTYTSPGKLPAKKFWVQHFPGFSSLDAFFGTTARFLKKIN